MRYPSTPRRRPPASWVLVSALRIWALSRLHQWPIVQASSTEKGLSKLRVLGSESTLVTPEKHDRMRRSIPWFESVTVQEATHMVLQDKPEEFEEAVRSFLDRIGW